MNPKRGSKVPTSDSKLHVPTSEDTFKVHVPTSEDTFKTKKPNAAKGSLLRRNAADLRKVEEIVQVLDVC